MSGGSNDHAARLAALRTELAQHGVDGFVLPRADAHQVEALPANAERLAWLTGFTGSAGMAAILTGTAAVFVDGRYTIQVRDQIDLAHFQPRHVSQEPLSDWLVEQLPDGGVVGYDPWLHTAATIKRWRSALAPKGIELKALAGNPVDAVWENRPAAPSAPVMIHDDAFAGKSAPAKRAEIADSLRERSIDVAVLASPESIAWILNIRGADVPNTPLTLSFALLNADGTAELFVDAQKLNPEVRAHLGNAVAIKPYEQIESVLRKIANEGRTILVDPQSMPEAIISAAESGEGKVVRDQDPCVLPRALKNAGEIEGARRAHQRDAVAVAKFLHWLDENAGDGSVDELAAERQLAAFRFQLEHFREPSFETITGAGPNGAIVHYRVTEETNRLLEPGSFYLVDSGGQFLDGTTDITRTVAIGDATPDMRRHFTLVLKGHIALSEARFPAGTTGAQLDSFARMPLWQAGLDYDHGTGHGVGSYLSVHEGPQRISKHPSKVALQPGMILSNEPGFYLEGAYGIRIENLVLVSPPEIVEGGEREMLGFETLTLAPIDRRAIEITMLTDAERTWVDAYHKRVLELVGPQLESPVVEWLQQATKPLGEGD